MIDAEVFARGWKMLENRFGKQPSGAAASYAEFLSPLMDNETFTIAAKALWATREFFPKPAAFFSIVGETEWRLVVECVQACIPPAWRWSEVWRKMSGRAQEAVKALGGIEAVQSAFTRDPLKARAAFLDAYGVQAFVEVFPQLGKPQWTGTLVIPAEVDMS